MQSDGDFDVNERDDRMDDNDAEEIDFRINEMK